MSFTTVILLQMFLLS